MRALSEDKEAGAGGGGGQWICTRGRHIYLGNAEATGLTGASPCFAHKIFYRKVNID